MRKEVDKIINFSECFTTTFPQIFGTNFIDLKRKKAPRLTQPFIFQRSIK